jgi:hypothetical protein
MKLVSLLVLFVSLTAINAHSLPLTVNGGWHDFEFPGLLNNGIYPGYEEFNDSGFADYRWFNSFEFSLTKPAFLRVQDLYQDVDQFAVFDNDIFIGLTSDAAGGQYLNDPVRDPDIAAMIPAFSYGVFFLDVGLHSIIGTNIRYQSTDFGGAAVLRVDTITVPEPATISLFVLAGVFFSFRFCRQSQLLRKF